MNPEIYVLSRPTFTQEYSRFLARENQDWKQTLGTEAERLVEFAGRICYMSFGKRQSDRTNIEYIDNLIEQGHESVLEHVNWTFLLTGVTRAFTHQLVRHRAGFAYSQLSQQYHDESDATFVPPKGIDRSPEALKLWRELITHSKAAYRGILSELGSSFEGPLRKRELARMLHSAARSVLPNCTETKIVITANARAIRHFLTVRGAIEGDYEMRLVCKLILEAVSSDAPALFRDFRIEIPSDELPVVIRG